MTSNTLMIGTAVGTVIGLPIVAQYTITQWKAKKTLMWIAGGISTAALASASYWYLTQLGTKSFAGEGHRHYDPKTKSFHAPAPPSTSGREFLSEARVLGLLRENPGSIFSIQFEKRDGSLRNMTARTGVWKGPGGDASNPRVTGEGMKYSPEDYNLRTVFDMQKGQYRHIGTDRVTGMTIGGRTYTSPSKV
jgi:hypothetical protein